MPMDSENTLYHVMSLRAEGEAMTGRDAVGATLPCLGTASETAPTRIEAQPNTPKGRFANRPYDN
jgi:hypothetical protein